MIVPAPRPMDWHRRILPICGLILGLSNPLVAMASEENVSEDVVVLQGLDKVTGRLSTLKAPVDKPVKFGQLKIIARHCEKTPPEEPPEATAFLEIWETKRGATDEKIFSSWMFASSPAVSALDHPVYDIWVKDCESDKKKRPTMQVKVLDPEVGETPFILEGDASVESQISAETTGSGVVEGEAPVAVESAEKHDDRALVVDVERDVGAEGAAPEAPVPMEAGVGAEGSVPETPIAMKSDVDAEGAAPEAPVSVESAESWIPRS